MRNIIYKISILLIFVVLVGCEQKDIWDNINNSLAGNGDPGIMRIECENFIPPSGEISKITIEYIFNNAIDNSDFKILISEKREVNGTVSDTSFYEAQGSLDFDNTRVTFHVYPQLDTIGFKIKLSQFHSSDIYLNDIIVGTQETRTYDIPTGGW